jgi:AcrR family transcriptional regulator
MRLVTVNPRATNDDLTAKARIRNAALDLYARDGEERTSLRAVAAAAGATLGLVQHHFKTKAGLRRAVDQLVIDYFAQTVAAVPTDGAPEEVASARDEAVRRMLEDNPPVVNYIRRVLLEPMEAQQDLLDAVVDFTRSEIGMLRDAGLASKKRPESQQIIAVLARQFGGLLLQPMVEAVWERAASKGEKRPRLVITVAD